MTCVCFRMYTEEEARKLGVVGWVKNTHQGTVTGQVQGPEDKVNAIQYFKQDLVSLPSAKGTGLLIQDPWKVEFLVECGLHRKSWLSKVGSPSSRIDRTNFSNEKEISKLDFSGFSTRY
ncbi:acylphosphatase-2 isoform X5 [Mycteria americana]|uniref:acylphosphatase-2 isoform X5 n=1 Tax=Mycteria americana TaxID=33587 RepID=UPI003F582B5A